MGGGGSSFPLTIFSSHNKHDFVGEKHLELMGVCVPQLSPPPPPVAMPLTVSSVLLKDCSSNLFFILHAPAIIQCV